MDTITHGITGALVAKAFFPEREGRWTTTAVTLGALFPDSDTFANLFYRDELAALQYHRGITHSWLALPAFALLLGALTCLLARQRRWLLFSCFYGIGIAAHIVLDLITSYGTMIWSPLSNVRVSWDMTFVIDLAFTTIVLLPQLAAWVYSDRHGAGRRGVAAWLCWSALAVAVWQLASWRGVALSGWAVGAMAASVAAVLGLLSLDQRGFRWRRSAYCRVGMAGLVIYLGLCQVAHQAALARVEEFARRSGARVQRLAALPAPPSLFRWSGLVGTAEGVHQGLINLADSAEPSYRFFPNAEKNRYLQAAERLAEVRTYLWFARFPWVTYRREKGLHVVEYRDVQFLGIGSGTDRFTYRIALDGEGRVLSKGFPGRGAPRPLSSGPIPQQR